MNIKENITAINQWPDRGIYHIEGIVIHSTWGTYQGSISWFKNPSAKVSAHYVIKDDGEITKCVEENAAAWHSGVVTTSLLKAPKLIKDRWGINPNLITIGIEYEDKRNSKWPYPKAQYAAGVELVADVCKRYGINPDRGVIIMHKEIDPINRSDPVGMWDQDKLINDVKKAMGLPELPMETRFVTVTAAGLNVREKPAIKNSKIVRVYKYGDGVQVKESILGESVSNINLWWRTIDDTFIWSGGCEEVLSEKGGKTMITQEEFNAKKALLDEAKKVLDARALDLSEQSLDLEEDLRKYTEDLAVLEAEPIESIVETTTVEEVKAEVPVEVPAESIEIKDEYPIEVKVGLQAIKDLISTYKSYLPERFK